MVIVIQPPAVDDPAGIRQAEKPFAVKYNNCQFKTVAAL